MSPDATGPADAAASEPAAGAEGTFPARPRVLFVDQTGELGGAELCLLDVARHYRRTGRVALLADGPFRERLEQAGVPVTVLAAPGAVAGVRRESGAAGLLRSAPGLLGLALRLARLARDYDLVFANTQKALIVGSLAGRLAGRPVAWYLHDILSPEHFSPGNRRIAVAAAKLAVRRVIANSRASAEAFVAAGGAAGRIGIVPNGIDPAPFDAVSAAELGRLRRRLGLPEAAPLAGVFSRLAPWKGQHVMITALSYLPGVHALLVGGALFGNEAYEATLREQAVALGVADRVHFLGFRDDVPALMRLVSVVAHTSTLAEPFGRVIVEGMLAGRPVVATRGGGPSEILDDPSTGVLIPPDDPAALAGALRRLLQGGAEARRLAAAGRERALARYSVAAMIAGLERELAHHA